MRDGEGYCQFIAPRRRDPPDEQGDTGGCTCPSRCSRVNTYPGARLTDGRSPWLGPVRNPTFSENAKKKRKTTRNIGKLHRYKNTLILKIRDVGLRDMAYWPITQYVVLFTYCL